MKKLRHIAAARYGIFIAAVWASSGCTEPVATVRADQSVVVGSKLFTEAIILGEIATQLARSEGLRATHRKQLGGTRVVFDALVSGQIDAYAEYSGTLYEEILAGISDSARVHHILDSLGLAATASLGFNNTYALGMQRDLAQKRGIRSISDLRNHPDLILGFSNEFMDRADGWPALRGTYRLTPTNVRGLDHELAYRGLASGDIHVTDLYSTDAEIDYYDLIALTDDRALFPRYDALFLYRANLAARVPEFVKRLHDIEGTLAESLIVSMNARVKLDRVPEHEVAADFLRGQGINVVVQDPGTRLRRIGRRTQEHLVLVLISLLAAIAAAIPLGVWAARSTAVAPLILGVVGVIYTIPSLALLVFMIPLLGIGGPPAVVALFLYSLLPIVRNTHAGLTDIPANLIESADALGLDTRARLRLVELPLATSPILTGIKTAAVINVGTATLGALIGAGGYGQPILTGIRLDDVGLILEGAVPAALLALLVQAVFDQIERRWSPGR